MTRSVFLSLPALSHTLNERILRRRTEEAGCFLPLPSCLLSLTLVFPGACTTNELLTASGSEDTRATLCVIRRPLGWRHLGYGCRGTRFLSDFDLSWNSCLREASETPNRARPDETRSLTAD